jgi:hypothetical protein
LETVYALSFGAVSDGSIPPLPLPVKPDSNRENMARCVRNKWQGVYKDSQESEEASGLIVSYLVAGSSMTKNSSLHPKTNLIQKTLTNFSPYNRMNTIFS